MFYVCKDSANREQYKMNSFIFIAEMPPILYKDSANREKNEMNVFIFIAEMPPILYKDSANREQYKNYKDKNCNSELVHFYCRDTSYPVLFIGYYLL